MDKEVGQVEIEKPHLTFRKGLEPFRGKITKVICHHPAHPAWGVKEIHDYHRSSLGWAGIGYNYFVTFDGRVQQGRGRFQGAHTRGHNGSSLGICFQGNFETQQMTNAQVKAGGKLIASILKHDGLSIADIVGHNDLAPTACPGKNFRMADLKEEVAAHLGYRRRESREDISDSIERLVKEVIKLRGISKKSSLKRLDSSSVQKVIVPLARKIEKLAKKIKNPF